jgi:hypothetical protein
LRDAHHDAKPHKRPLTPFSPPAGVILPTTAPKAYSRGTSCLPKHRISDCGCERSEEQERYEITRSHGDEAEQRCENACCERGEIILVQGRWRAKALEAILGRPVEDYDPKTFRNDWGR